MKEIKITKRCQDIMSDNSDFLTYPCLVGAREDIDLMIEEDAKPGTNELTDDEWEQIKFHIQSYWKHLHGPYISFDANLSDMCL